MIWLRTGAFLLSHPPNKSILTAQNGWQKDTPSYMVGKVFLRQIDAATLSKCTFHTSSFRILSNRLRTYLRNIHYPFCCFGDFFSFCISGQRKEAKERRFGDIILISFFMKSFWVRKKYEMKILLYVVVLMTGKNLITLTLFRIRIEKLYGLFRW